MTKAEWKKNDDLIKTALKKMDLQFKRNQKTWEAAVYCGKHHLECYGDDDDFILDGPNTPESLGNIKYFFSWYEFDTNVFDKISIENIFFGVESYEELKMKVDLML